VPAPQDVVGTSCRDGVVDELLQFGLEIDERHAVPRECGVRIGVDTADFHDAALPPTSISTWVPIRTRASRGPMTNAPVIDRSATLTLSALCSRRNRRRGRIGRQPSLP